MSLHPPTTSRHEELERRWAGLAGRSHGEPGIGGSPIVLLHGLTFDHQMWGPVIDALSPTRRVLALDLPGHGDSAPLPGPGLWPAAEAIHRAVLDAKLDPPVLVGHSIGGPIAAIYAAQYPAAGVISVEAPIRVEPFAELLRSLHTQLSGDGFTSAWAMYQASFHMELLPASMRALVAAGDRPGDDRLQQQVLSYQADLLETPLEEVIRRRDDGMGRLRASATPYVTLHSSAVDRADHTWLHDRLPQAEILVSPVGHHFPHLADPARFAALLTGFAAAAR